MSDLPKPIPAATLILMRAAAVGPPELLFMERAADMAFAAGALVFPGGRIDPGDDEAARIYGDGGPGDAARIATIRETIEETGVAAAIAPPPDRETVEMLRAGLAAGRPFPELLDQAGLRPDLDALTPFARWCPNFRETRRFDTLFFLAEAPAEAEPTSDAGEAVRAFWATAAQVLEEVAAGRAHAIFPTRRNLERLARFASIEEARADAARHELRKITPWIETRDGGPWVCIPDDAGYPVTAEPLATARRR